jgi:hypothetical protein
MADVDRLLRTRNGLFHKAPVGVCLVLRRTRCCNCSLANIGHRQTDIVLGGLNQGSKLSEFAEDVQGAGNKVQWNARSPFSMRLTVDKDAPIRVASDSWEICRRRRARARSLPSRVMARSTGKGIGSGGICWSLLEAFKILNGFQQSYYK